MWVREWIGKMTPVDRLKLLTIDLDDTVWPCLPAIRRAEDALYAWLEVRAPRVTGSHDEASLRAHRKNVARSNPGIAHDLTAVRHASLSTLVREFGYAPQLADEAIALFLERRNQVEPFADVIPALRELGKRYRLVSVTNGNSDVAQTPLRGLFHLSLTAAGVGAQKPNPALFQGALDWAGVTPAEALHLGDDPRLDVEAARRIGMGSVWVNRAGTSWPEDLEPPVAEVRGLAGFATLLEDCAVGV
jgi:putative hydrolase of the HAD superfamily